MSAARPLVPDTDHEASLAFLDALFPGREFAVRLWNGDTLPPPCGRPALFTMVLKHPGALRRMFSSPTDLSLGEAYIYDDYDIEGDIASAVAVGKALTTAPRSAGERLRLFALLKRLPSGGPRYDRRRPGLRGKVHSIDRDRSAIRYHYDVSNDFYKLFLDSCMIYSGGRFTRPDEDLDSAQRAKLDRICRLLDLRPGDRFLDIGCGWGGLILYAAEHFGVDALGITLSARQAELARRRVRKAGLNDRCRIEICDYRELNTPESFAKISSVGMVEHVGARLLPAYFEAIGRLLRPGGLFFNSGITRHVDEPAHRKGSFTATYVFPDGELETTHETVAAAENAGLEMCWAENGREDYAVTLRHWVRRLEDNADEARRLTDDVTYRIWRLYMAGSAVRFTTGELNLLVMLLRKPASAPCQNPDATRISSSYTED